MSNTYRLRSSSMIFTPGVVQWAIYGYRFPDEKDRKYLRSIFKKGWNLPAKVSHALLSGAVPYRVTEDEAVEFEVAS